MTINRVRNPINVSGKQLVDMARDMFKTASPSIIQIQYVMNMLQPTSYLLQHHTVKGHPITYTIPNRDTTRAFSHRPWQIDVINDQYKEKTIIKSRQLGFSEVGVSEMLWFCDTHSYDSVNVLYTFPTQDQMQDFVNSRINPQFASGYYSTLIKNNDSVKMKQIRNSRMMFRSSSTGKALEGVDVDGLSLDEYDRLNPTAEISAKESLSSSKYGLLRRWSTPTMPNMGIDLKYAESDQRKWVYKCQHCGLVQQLDYDKNIKLINEGGIDLIGKIIDEGTYQYVCQKCGKPIDRWYTGFWDITAPRAGRAHGYEISQMDAVWISASQIKAKELSAPSKQFFFNYTLGRPYQDNSNTLFEQDITSHMDDSVSKSELRGDYRLVTVGIDWGQHQHSVVVTGMKPNGRVDLIGLKRIDRSEGVDEIERDLYQIVNYIRPFEPDLILPDIGYNGNYNDRLTQIFGKEVVYGVKVRSAKSNGDYNAHFNDGVSTVTIDKLSQNLIAMNEIKAGDIHFYNNYDTDLQLYAKHWENVVIRQEESKDGKSVDTVITRKGGD